MKKIMLALFMFSATATLVVSSTKMVYAKGGDNNTIPASQVPAPVLKSFAAQYPTAKQTQWEFKPVYYGTPLYTASFKIGSQKWEANYYADGSFISAYPR